MKNAIEIERVRNGWIIREGHQIVSGAERVTTRESDLESYLKNWLDGGGREYQAPKPFQLSAAELGEEE